MSNKAARIISEAELAVLKAALACSGTNEARDLANARIDALRVYRSCDCGCASIGFLPTGKADGERPKVVADCIGRSEDGEEVGVIVFGVPGRLVELECYWSRPEGAPLPCPETLVSWGSGQELSPLRR